MKLGLSLTMFCLVQLVRMVWECFGTIVLCHGFRGFLPVVVLKVFVFERLHDWDVPRGHSAIGYVRLFDIGVR